MMSFVLMESSQSLVWGRDADALSKEKKIRRWQMWFDVSLPVGRGSRAGLTTRRAQDES